MKLQKLYEAAVSHGVSVDPRGKKRVSQDLAAAKKAYGELKKDERARFDAERLTNPYSDTRILWGDADVDVRAVLVGIDIEVGEVLLADRLIAKGRRIDALWAHHPEGAALANLGGVMAMQADILSSFGVPIAAAEGLLEPRIREVERLVMPTNHMRAVDAARLLEIPMICTHTPADNCVADHLQRLFDRRKPETVGDVVEVLRDIPEYRDAEPTGAGPRIFSGSARRRSGRVFVDMTGGTSGSEKTLEKISNTSDVGTIVAMHMPEKHREEAEKHHLNVVIAGHIASDTLGMNLLIDGVEKATGSTLTVVECSGFKRYRRGRR